MSKGMINSSSFSQVTVTVGRRDTQGRSLKGSPLARSTSEQRHKVRPESG